MPKRKAQPEAPSQDRPAEAPTQGAEQPVKRRKSIGTASRAGQASHSPRRGSGAGAAAAAAAAAAGAAAGASEGRAESDTEDDYYLRILMGEERDPEGGDSKGESASKAERKEWHGVKAMKATHQGRPLYRAIHTGPPPLRDVWLASRLRTPEAAACLHDRALIAAMGPKAAAAKGLNFPASQYPGEQQRWGPELHAYLLELGGRAGEEEVAQESLLRRPKRKADPRLPEYLEKAWAATRARSETIGRRAEVAVAERRRADPLWCRASHRDPGCGVCPVCRQPWRTDLGVCLFKSAAKAAGHSEQLMVRLLARDPAYRTEALELQRQRQGREEQQQQQQAQQQAQQAQQAQQQQGDGERLARQEGEQQRRGAPRAGRGPEPSQLTVLRRQRQAAGGKGSGWEEGGGDGGQELVWLEPPPQDKSRDGGLQRRKLLEKGAVAAVRQRMAWQEAQLGGEAAQERQRGAPAGAAEPAGRLASGGPEEEAHLLGPGSQLARAEAPHDVVLPPNLGDVVQLAALCRQGGLEAPLAADVGQEVLEAEEERQAQQQHLARLLQQRGGGGGGDSGAAVSADLADAAAAAAAAGGAAEEAQRVCLVCGGAAHPAAACPVVRMALAVPKPAEECPGCAHLERPGCEQCCKGSIKLGQAWVWRAPWLDSLAPATRGLMLAVQLLAGAAVADLDLPHAAWHCTPKALLAVGLMAEEAARCQLAARLPPKPPAPTQQQ